MPFPTKEERSKCWEARDKYWECLDIAEKKSAKEGDECKDLLKIYTSSCPGQWVKHFDRKRKYLKFKEKMEKGYDPLKDK